MSIIPRSLAPALTLALAALCPATGAAQSYETPPPAPETYLSAPSDTPLPSEPPVTVAPSAPAPQAPPTGYSDPRARRYQSAPYPPYPRVTETPARVYRPERGRAIIGYRTETRNPPELWGTGIGLAAGGWVLNLILTAAANSVSTERPPAVEQDAQAWAAVPFVGPFLQLALEAPHPAMPILTGLIQYAGLISFIVGVTTQQVNRAPIYEGSPDDPSMLRVELDASGGPDGAFVGITVRHL